MKHRFRHLLDDNDEGDDEGTPTTTKTFIYDAEGRLVEQHDPEPEERYPYDPNVGPGLKDDELNWDDETWDDGNE